MSFKETKSCSKKKETKRKISIKKEEIQRVGEANQRTRNPKILDIVTVTEIKSEKKLKAYLPSYGETEMGKPLTVVYLVALLVLTVSAAAEEGNDSGCSAAVNSATDLKYKIVAIFSTLIFGVFGVCLPIFGLDGDGFFYACVRQFGAYVMLLASVIYILPDATASLTSSCVGDFPMTGVVVARAAAILTMIESKSFASAFMNISHSENHNGDDDHVDNSASQGHSVSRQVHNKIRQKLVTRVDTKKSKPFYFILFYFIY